jgi:ferredoxin
MKAQILESVCIGCGLCTVTCPEVFKMVNDKASVYVNLISPEVKNACLGTAEDCPVDAIEVLE